ncbi:hypothetical protein SFC07_05635 [Corynebacterium callunae]|uniref:hypothetical protein n=1 Tax=Corynebacterium callunae TaxID=1721 RepID=UPI003982B4AE
MRTFPARLLAPVLLGTAVLSLSTVPASHAAVGAMLAQVPSGDISCDTAAAYWTSDADYQNKVAQAQALAAFDSRGNEILAALARVDAAAESCGLKGTVGSAATESATESGTGAGTGTSDSTGTTGTGAGAASGAGSTTATPTPGASGTVDSPITDAAAVLGSVRSNTGTPMKTIEILGQGQVEVADADAMMANFLRQFTMIV